MGQRNKSEAQSVILDCNVWITDFFKKASPPKMLDLEVKDVPYLVAAFQHTAILVSNDLRSLVNKRNLIENNLGVQIRTPTEFFASK